MEDSTASRCVGSVYIYDQLRTSRDGGGLTCSEEDIVVNGFEVLWSLPDIPW